ncbi:hypothetical protein HS088_TW06G01158 [Tripterygium wilfordii]|uniref:Autophagy-related protein 18h n=1 Tax=Tripterygium wilfordii TaxID=458696 RepID=A0A7J7DKX5_TRIWF|nr:autophagy-related protein 18h-like [Tripterygium wilfordii]KAF5746981.1 hypothetical protein HS088_TW06G01158 [Tripterygium wilfordii]
MKNNINGKPNNNHKNSNGFIPNSLKFISSCIKTASYGVRSAGATVAASISGDNQDLKDQVLWASFDRLEVGPSSFKRVLLIGYCNGFQVIDVQDASDVNELVSRRDDPVTFLQIQPFPTKSDGHEGFIASHPVLLVVACDESKSPDLMHSKRDGLVRDGYSGPQTGSPLISPTVVRFYSIKSHNYIHVLRFRSTVYMVRCSPRIVAVGLAAQIYCFDALTLENKFSVLTYPVPQLGGPGYVGVNVGYGPMAVGPRWLAYASNSPLQSNTGRLSPQSLTPSPGASPSTSPGSGNLVARYAMESSKQLATGLLNLGDMGYKTLSKYCHDFIPDGSSSPVSSNSGWRVGRGASHLAETDVAGMVVVKDFLSRTVISQFRAHTSPISALCFDPSGTLLVTASVHGNNINIFRIMPSCFQNGSSNRSYDWSYSHVHLYKLHRGMTSAVIQDICFSHCSRWIGIISSRGTCHIFALSPFGGENVLQIRNSDVDGPSISPVLPLPWWSTPYFMANQHSFSSLPPASVTLSVVSRIKCSHLGWLGTVSSAASSVAGKTTIPSGATAAIFHNSVRHDLQPAHLKSVTALEHLLVFAPSGHVVQHKLLSAIGGETNESVSRNLHGSSAQMQDEELRVRVEAVQWWDVCRRADWPEREECISGITLGRQETVDMVMDVSECDDNKSEHKELKSHERSHLYVSNAELHVNSGRIPVWQKSNMHFHMMAPVESDEVSAVEVQSGGESQVEIIPVNEVEIRQRDLLPVLDHFHRVQSGWSNRGFIGEKYSISSPDSHGGREKLYEGAAVIHSNLLSPDSVDNSDGGSSINSYPPMFQSGNVNTVGKAAYCNLGKPALNSSSLNKDSGVFSVKQSTLDIRPVEDYDFRNNLSSLTSGSLSEGRNIAKEAQSSNSSGTSEVSNISSNRSDLSMNMIDEGAVNDSPDFEQFFQEGYCKASPSSECRESTGIITDVDSNSSPCDIEKCMEDGDNDDMLGGVFDFSEEG